MPVEIKELIIRAVVEQDRASTQDAQSLQTTTNEKEALDKLASAFDEPPELPFWLESLNLKKDDLIKAKELSYDGFKSYNLKLLKFLRKHTKLVSFPYDEELK